MAERHEISPERPREPVIAERVSSTGRTGQRAAAAATSSGACERGDEFELIRGGNRLRPVPHAKLAEDVLRVRAHRLRADEQPVRNLVLLETVHHEAKDLELSPRQVAS